MKAEQIRAQLDEHKKKLSEVFGKPDEATVESSKVASIIVLSLFAGEIAFQLATLNEKLEVDSLFRTVRDVGDKIDAMEDRRRGR